MAIKANINPIKLKELYLQDLTYREIGRILNVSNTAVFNQLRETDYYKPKQRFKNITEDEIKREYLNHPSLAYLAKKYKVSKTTILRAIKHQSWYVSRENKKSIVIGRRYGNLVVQSIENRGKNQRWALCICDCNREKIVAKRCSGLHNGNIISCGCLRKRGYKEISGYYFYKIVDRCQFSQKEMSISIEFAWELFLKQDRKCALSGVELTFGKRGYLEQTASLDRIDSSKGYIESNVQWVHKCINKMKMDYSQQDYIKYCCLVADNYRNKNK